MPSIKRHSNDMGRPSSYTSEIADEICERLANGESLRAICRDEHMPDRGTVVKWVIDDIRGFSSQYAQARETGLDALADEIVEIADTDPGTLDNGATDSGAVAHNRLRFDARRWYLSKLAPKKYGDKQTVAHEGGMTLQVVTGVTDPSDITDLI